MFKKYREVKLSTKLLVLFITTLLTLAISIRVNYNLPIAAGVVVGLLLSFNAIASKPKTTLSVLIVLMQAIVVGYASYYFGAFFGGVGLDFSVFALITLSILGTSSLVITFLAFKFSYGKVWLTLALSFILLNISGFLIGSASELDFTVSMLISAVIGIGFAALRTIKIFGRKTKPEYSELRNKMRNSTAAKTAIQDFTKNKWEYVDSAQNNNSFIVDTGKTLAVVFPLSFSTQVTTNGKDIFYENISLGNFFSELIEEAKKITVAGKIPQKNVTVIVLDTSGKYPLPVDKFDKLRLTAKNDSRDTLNEIIISNNRGLFNYNESLPAPKKDYNSRFLTVNV